MTPIDEQRFTERSLNQNSDITENLIPIVSATFHVPSQITSKVSAKAKDMMRTDPMLTENLRKSTLSLSAMAEKVDE